MLCTNTLEDLQKNWNRELTLRADQDERYLCGVPVMRHLRVVAVDGVEAGFVL